MFGYSGIESRNEINSKKLNPHMWSSGSSGILKSSVDWNPGPSYSGGGAPMSAGMAGFGGGGPLGADNQNMVWDEVRGGYWIKETVVENGMMQSGAQGYGSSGGFGTYGAVVPTNGSSSSGAITGWSGCKGCSFGQMKTKSSCSGCTSNRVNTAISAPGNFVSTYQVNIPAKTQQTQVASFHLPTPYHGCRCGSSQTTAYPVVDERMYSMGGRSCGGGCGGGGGGGGVSYGFSACGCHSPPGCSNCGAYH